MVERAAEAMAQVEGLDWKSLSEDPYAPNSKPLFRQRARAAIEAMRAPNKEIVAALYESMKYFSSREDHLQEWLETAWEDAINAALGE